ncbi:unnamed protein product [Pylaiella littoralis]
MDKLMVVVLAALLLCAHSAPLQQQAVAEERSYRAPAPKQQKSARDPQGQQEERATSGYQTTAESTTPVAGVVEHRTEAVAPPGRSGDAVLGTVNGVRGSAEDALEEAVTRAVQVKAMHTLEGEDQGVGSGSVVEAVEVGGAEEDKGIEEGEAGGFVVVARDSKPGEGDPRDSLENDSSSTNGISNNIMVIVFCALAFVANGGFLVYVFWVM